MAERLFAQHLRNRGLRTGGASGIVHQARVAEFPGEPGGCPERCGCFLHDVRHALLQIRAHLRRERAHRARKVGASRHHVARRAGMELAHGDHRWVERRNIAAHHHLQRLDDGSAHHYRIDALVRHGAVSSRPRNIHAEPVAVRHAGAGLHRNRAGVHLAPYMRGEDGVHAFQRSGLNHLAGPDGNLFGRLEDDAHLATKLLADGKQQANRAQHHGHVAVVPAGMHNAFVSRSERHVRFLQHRQGVHVGAQGNATARVAIGTVGVGGTAANGGNDARFGHATVLNAQRVQFGRNPLRRFNLLPAQLGVGMEVPTHLYYIRLDFRRAKLQLGFRRFNF